jgi:HK97 gp10 family phage protein
VTIRIEGLADLERQLSALGDLKAIRRVGRAALREGGRPIMETARSLAPDDPATGSGNYLRASIKMATGRGDRGDDGDQVFVVIGIDRSIDPPVMRPRADGSGSYRDPGVAGVAGIIEFGRPGVAARPFMRPAFDQHALAVPGIVAAALGPAIEKEAAKLAKRGA